jgi:hypothetical protein
MSRKCHGYGCSSTKLIKAHLTPRSIGRHVQDKSSPNLLVSPYRYTKALPLGLYDANILCEACDGLLNTRYDDPAFEFLKAFPSSPKKVFTNGVNSYFQMLNVDCDLLCGFVLSILWRYSISTLPDASGVSLGPFEDRAGEVLWGVTPLATLPEFQVVCQRYTIGTVNTEKMYSSPVDMKGPDFNSYGFSMLGFHFLGKVDHRPFPPIYAPFVMNGSRSLRGYFVDFHDTPQGRGAREMLAGARRRRGNKRPR